MRNSGDIKPALRSGHWSILMSGGRDTKTALRTDFRSTLRSQCGQVKITRKENTNNTFYKYNWQRDDHFYSGVVPTLKNILQLSSEVK